jgi:hypothetical protein
VSNYEEIKELVKRISGRDSVISIQRVYLDIFSDLHDAAVLSQCVFWSDKGRYDDGWFYKSLPEWRSEIGIKRSSLETAINHLEACGVVETEVRSGGKHNSPTMHYRVNMDNLTNLVIHYLQEQLSGTDVRSVESSISEEKPTGGRSVESSISDLLNPADRPAESSISSYSSLHRSLQAEEKTALRDPIWDKAEAALHLSWNGTFEKISPRLVAVDENPHKFTVLVNANAAGIKPTIEAAVAQAARDLKLRRKISINLVTEWPGLTEPRRVREVKTTGSKAQTALAGLLEE